MVRLRQLALVWLLWAGGARAKSFWLAERLELTGGHAYTEPVFVLTAQPGGEVVTTPCQLLAQGEEYWACGQATVTRSGNYGLAVQLRRDGQPLTLPLRGTRAFRFSRLDVSLIIDASRSMKDNDPDNLRVAAVRRFFELARNSERIETISLIAFQTESEVLLEPTPPAEVTDLERYLDRLKPKASTDFDKPFADAIDLFGRTHAPGKAILFLSDGQPRKRYAESHRRLADLDCPIHTIGLSDESDKTLLGRIAAETGGRFFDAPSADELDAHFVQIFHLLDRPRTISTGVSTVDDEAELPFLIDATMRNPIIKLAPISGRHTATYNGQTVYRSDGDLTMFTVPQPAPNAARLQFSGSGKLSYELVAATDLFLDTIQLQQTAPVEVPVVLYAYLAGAERCQQVVADCQVLFPDGHAELAALTQDPTSGLYHGEIAGTRSAGLYKIMLTLHGRVAGTEFRRSTTMTYTREADHTEAAATEARPIVAAVRAPAQLIAPRPAPLLAPQLPTPALAPATGEKLQVTYWVSRPEITLESYPDVPVSETITVLVSGAEVPSVSARLMTPAAAAGRLQLDGLLQANARSELTVTFTPGRAAAGLALDSVLRISAGDQSWRVPIRAAVAVPQIVATILDPEVTERPGAVDVETWLHVSVQPAGRVDLAVASTLPNLVIAPPHLAAQQVPIAAALRMVLTTPLQQREWQGTITVSGPRLASVDLPYSVTIAQRSEVAPKQPGQDVAAEVIPTSFTWLWLLILFGIILLILLIAAVRGNRRAVFILASIAMHLLLLLIILPRHEKPVEGPPEPTVSTIKIESEAVLQEQQIRSEVAAFTPASETPDESAVDKTEAELEAESDDASQALEAEQKHEKTEIDKPIETAEPVTREELAVDDLAQAAEEIERKRQEAEAREAAEQSMKHEKSETEVADEVVENAREVTVEEVREVTEQTDATEIESEVERAEITTADMQAQAEAFERKRRETAAAAAAAAAQQLERVAEEVPAQAPAAQAQVTVTEVRETREQAEAKLETSVERSALQTADMQAQAEAFERKQQAESAAAAAELSRDQQPVAAVAGDVSQPTSQTTVSVVEVREVSEQAEAEAAAVGGGIARGAVETADMQAQAEAYARKHAAAAAEAAAAQAAGDLQPAATAAAAPAQTVETSRAMQVTLAEPAAAGELAADPAQVSLSVDRQSVTTTDVLPTSAAPARKHQTAAAASATGPSAAAATPAASVSLAAVVVGSRVLELTAAPGAEQATPELQSANSGQGVSRQDVATADLSAPVAAVPRKTAAETSSEATSQPATSSGTTAAVAIPSQNDLTVTAAVFAPTATRQATAAKPQLAAARPLTEGTETAAVTPVDLQTPMRALARAKATAASALTVTPRSGSATAAVAVARPVAVGGVSQELAVAPVASTPAVTPAAAAAVAPPIESAAPSAAAPSDLTLAVTAPTRQQVEAPAPAATAVPTSGHAQPAGLVPAAPAGEPTAARQLKTAAVRAPTAAIGEAPGMAESTAGQPRSRAPIALADPAPVAKVATQVRRPAQRDSAGIATGPQEARGNRLAAALMLPRAAHEARPARAFEAAAPDRLAAPAATGGIAPALDITVVADRSRRRGGGNVLPLVSYSGDWDCDATAMINLAYQLERRTGSLMPFSSKVVPLGSPDVNQAPFIFMTGHKDFTFTPTEVDSMRHYLENGGYVWINDSTDIGDEVYDIAVRRELARVLPGVDFERLPADSPIFRGPYDLTKGYKGYAIPPGDKYRQDYLEGLRVKDRLAVIYTRNDYGDGLEINPHTHPLMASLSDLSPEEMMEGSVRMGTNIVMHFLNRGAVDTGVQEALRADQIQEAKDPWAGLQAPTFPLLTALRNWQQPGGWEDVIQSTALMRQPSTLVFDFRKPGNITRRDKAVIGSQVDITIERQTVLLLDIESHLRGGARMALAFTGADGEDYVESAPAYIKPGDNPNIAFDFRKATFKSGLSKWEYRQALPPTRSVGYWYLVLYPQEPRGVIAIRNPRLVRP